MKIRHQGAVLVLAMSAVAPLHAQDWKHEVAPYVWGSGMDGSTAVGDLTADVNMSFGDILDNLEAGFMGMYRGKRDRLSVMLDGVYMALGNWARGPAGYTKADVDMDQLALEADVGYDVLEHLTLVGGLRYIDLSVDVRATGPLGTRKDGLSESWVDPVIGAIYTIPIAERWSCALRGDIGGFGVGSDFAWQGMVVLRWQASERVGVGAAYRYIDIDYESGKGADYFKYDMAISGPALGVVFSF